MIYVALLRGINVGGNRKVEMKRLKACFEAQGLEKVRTYINSGNVIFSSDRTDTEVLTSEIEAAIETDFGFPVVVLLRDLDAVRVLAESLPGDWANDESAKCDVMFLGSAVDSPSVVEELSIKPGIDHVIYAPGAILWRVERPKVTRSGMLKIVGTPLYASMSVRNCNTLRKVHALMEQAAADERAE